MLLCRTDPETRRAKGISCLLVDMKSPGISVRPLRQMTGEAEFNEMFFDAVRVPRENLLGELHGGWQIAVASLQNERGILYVVSMQILLKQARDHLLALARERGAGRDGLLRQDLARVYLGTEIFGMTCQRTLDKLLRMGMPGPEASIIKLHWTELTQAMPEIAMQLLGPDGLLYDTPRPEDGTHAPPEQWVQRGYLGARATGPRGRRKVLGGPTQPVPTYAATGRQPIRAAAKTCPAVGHDLPSAGPPCLPAETARGDIIAAGPITARREGSSYRSRYADTERQHRKPN